MKISDVEFQGDGSKATFYYTAEGRVDFRQLIKDMARAFSVRIEMRQIGFRQEAARLGGIGSCGRELCCATWLTDFRSVSTSAARYQQLSLNPQKISRTVRQTEVLFKLRVRHLPRCTTRLPSYRYQAKHPARYCQLSEDRHLQTINVVYLRWKPYYVA